MTYRRLEEYLLRQNYGLLCEMLFYQLILYKAILCYEASFTFHHIKSKNICLEHDNKYTKSILLIFKTVSEDRQRTIRYLLYKLIYVENIVSLIKKFIWYILSKTIRLLTLIAYLGGIRRGNLVYQFVTSDL